jgi:hypothetical protein
LCWIAIGGLSFWLPYVVVMVAFHEDVDWGPLNAVALAGVTVLCAASWLVTKKPPEWGWILAGIYILGPASMFAISLFRDVPFSPDAPGEYLWLLFFLLFPPMTLWISLVSGMLLSLLLATVILLAAHIGARELQSKRRDVEGSNP